jgi:DNA-directed RNA polymerase II subunit RPB1
MKVQEVWSFDPSLISERRYATKMLRIVIRSRLASKRITNEFCISQRALDWLFNRIIEDYSFSIVQPGEAVGILSAQSNGEPQQQMTLNTVTLFVLRFYFFTYFL